MTRLKLMPHTGCGLGLEAELREWNHASRALQSERVAVGAAFPHAVPGQVLGAVVVHQAVDLRPAALTTNR